METPAANEAEFPGGLDLRTIVNAKRQALEAVLGGADHPPPRARTGAPFAEPTCAEYYAAAWGALDAAQACFEAGQLEAASTYLSWGQQWASMC